MNKLNEYFLDEIIPQKADMNKPNEYFLNEIIAQNPDKNEPLTDKKPILMNKSKKKYIIFCIILMLLIVIIAIVVPVVIVENNNKNVETSSYYPNSTINPTMTLSTPYNIPTPTSNQCQNNTNYYISGIPGCPSNNTNFRSFNECYTNSQDVYLTFSINCITNPLVLSIFSDLNCTGQPLNYTLSSICEELNLGLLQSLANSFSYWIKL